MNKYYFALIFVICISCKAIKIDELELDYTQSIKGEVKSIIATQTSFKINKNDTIKRETKIELFFDKNQNKVKQVDHYGGQTYTTHYIYNQKNLLIKKYSKTHDSVIDSSVEYSYDNDRNLIEYRNFIGGKLHYIKKNTYDRHGNVILRKVSFPDNPKNTTLTKFFYNYKLKNYSFQSFDTTLVAKGEIKSKTYFDNNGNLVKSETFNDKDFKNLKSYWLKTYDRNGNLVRTSFYDGNGKLNGESHYVSTFDKQGNITNRTYFSNGKISESTVCKIDYY